MMSKASDRKYDDFDPVSDLISEEGCDALILYLPGFRKEQLKVQLTTSRILRISGERPIGDNKWRRFNKEFQIPPNVDIKEITAKFEGGILHIRQPKLSNSVVGREQDKVKQAAEVTKSQTQQEAHLPQPQPEKGSDGFTMPPSEFPGSRESEAITEKKKARKEDSAPRREEDEKPSTGENIETKQVSAEKLKKLLYDGRLIKELKKPEKQKRIGVIVLLLLVMTLIGLYIVKMDRPYSQDVSQSVVEYKNQGFQYPT